MVIIKKINKMNRMNKKGWLRILEVFLSILIIMGAILIVMSRTVPETHIGDDVYEKQRVILDIVSKNESLRKEIIVGDTDGVNNFIYKMIPGTWDFATNACNLDEICSNPRPIYDKEVYVTEVVISSNLSYYSPKKLRFFVWSK